MCHIQILYVNQYKAVLSNEQHVKYLYKKMNEKEFPSKFSCIFTFLL